MVKIRSNIKIEFCVLCVLVVLLAISSWKIYDVYSAFEVAQYSAFESQSPEETRGLWRNVIRLNAIKKIRNLDVISYTNLGNIEFERGNFGKAFANYKKALDLKTSFFESNLGIAKMAYKQSDWKTAAEQYGKIIKLKPKNKELYSPFASACLKGNRIDVAIKMLKEFKEPINLQLQGVGEYAEIGSAFLFNALWENAILGLEKASEFSPKDLYLKYLLAKAYKGSKRYKLSINKLKEIIDYKKTSTDKWVYIADAHFQLGDIYESQGEIDKAIREYKKVLCIVPSHLDGLKSLKKVLNLKGKEKEARLINEKTKQITPNNLAEKAIFDKRVQFLGCDIEPAINGKIDVRKEKHRKEQKLILKHGDKFRVTYYWKCLGNINKAYFGLVEFKGRCGRFNNDHLIGEKAIAFGNTILRQFNSANSLKPKNLTHLTSKWNIGKVVKESYEISVPVWIGTGDYSVNLSLKNSRFRDARSIEIAKLTIRPKIIDIPLDPGLIHRLFGDNAFDLKKRVTISQNDEVVMNLPNGRRIEALGIISYTGCSISIPQGEKIAVVEIIDNEKKFMFIISVKELIPLKVGLRKTLQS